ncbi:MAG TPA: hypothetical protein VN130_01970 [Xanthobacteraceae bacterium]|nr:hypothetical protein [Xanthobacteraceae bacterium]
MAATTDGSVGLRSARTGAGVWRGAGWDAVCDFADGLLDGFSAWGFSACLPCCGFAASALGAALLLDAFFAPLVSAGLAAEGFDSAFLVVGGLPADAFAAGFFVSAAFADDALVVWDLAALVSGAACAPTSSASDPADANSAVHRHADVRANVITAFLRTNRSRRAAEELSLIMRTEHQMC